MGNTIFWSWQSDLDGRVTRDVIRYALDAAITMIAADLEEADRPSLTSDTQGVAGTPDIVATILRKIDQAAVFVGDVTPIAVSASGKACANPNVLLEMGYANKALGEHRVIQVWNTAFDGAALDKLPFDMRGRRGPVGFHLPPEADTAELRKVRGDLAKRLAEHLKLALEQLPAPPPEAIRWQQHHPGEQDVWFDPAEPQNVTNTSFGSSRVSWQPRHTGYARIIPAGWRKSPDAKETLANLHSHAALLAADAREISSGISRGGAMVYWPGKREAGLVQTHTLTQWFENTGEFWGLGGGFLFERDGRITLATGYLWKPWLHFLEKNAKLAAALGGSLPIHVRIGISNLKNTWWPRGRYQFDDEGYVAVEDAYEFDGALTSLDTEAVRALVLDAFNGLAAVYGIAPLTYEQLLEHSKY